MDLMSRGLSTTQIGVITAIGPFASLLLQTAWGRLADRTNRKFILMLALATSGLSALLYLLGTSYPYILGVATLFVLVNMSVLPMSDAMALEFCTNNRFHFAPVRMCGTIGYAIMPVLLGGLFSVHLHYIFPTFCALCLIAAAGTCFFPKSIAKAPVRAGKSSGVRILPLLRDPFVIFLLTANFVISIGICAYTYLPLYASNMGYDNNLCGLLNAVAATRQSLLNVKAILEEARLTLANVVKTTVYLADMGDFAAMNEIYSQFFSQPFPARSAVAVKALPKGALVEVEVIAARG